MFLVTRSTSTLYTTYFRIKRRHAYIDLIAIYPFKYVNAYNSIHKLAIVCSNMQCLKHLFSSLLKSSKYTY